MSRRPTGRSPLTPDRFFVIRAPLLPWDRYRALVADGADAPSRTPGSPHDYVRACRRTRRRMMAVLADPAFREALAVSSPSLLADLSQWIRDPRSPRGAAVERGLLKYIIRAATRCTPFGLMAGVALGTIDDTVPTNLHIPPDRSFRRHVRADARLILAAAAVLAADERIRPHLTYHPNSTLYPLGGWYRHHEGAGHPYGGNGRLVSVRRTPEVELLVRTARGGATWETLVQALLSHDDDITRDEAAAFLHDVVGSQLLVPDIFPPALGEEMLDRFLRRTADLPLPPVVRDLLAAVRRYRDLLAVAPPGRGRDVLQAADTTAHRFFARLEAAAGAGEDRGDPAGTEPAGDDEANHRDICFQVDMTFAAPDLHLSGRELAPVIQALLHLQRLGRRENRTALGEFAAAFRRRYGEREMPLCEVLDPDHGIRFGTQGWRQAPPSPLLRLPVGQNPRQAGPALPGSSLDAWRAELLTAAARDGREEIVLDPAELRARFPDVEGPPLPAVFPVMLSRLEGEDGPRWLLIGSHGSPAQTLLGRFAHVLGAPLANHLRRMVEEEQAVTGDLLAGVAYLPPSRLANVCQQPPLRRRVIPYGTPPLSGEGESIPLDDLLVSVWGDRVILCSRRLGRRIIPRIDHALNIAHPTSPAVFNFLGMLQYQDTQTGLGWSWGRLAGLPFLPRVVIGDVIVAPRTWNLSGREVDRLTAGLGKGSCETGGLAAYRRLQEWRRERGVPRSVAVGTMTDYLVTDLVNPLTADLFLRQVRRQRRLRETFLAERAAATGATGGRVHEIVLPVWSRRPREARSERTTTEVALPTPAHPDEQVLGIGDGVLYARIYGGEQALDAFLRGELGTALADWRRAGLVDDWFFVRYANPDHHLRIRLFGRPENLGGRVLPALENVIHRSGPVVHRMVIDGYRPEVARYGGPTGLPLCHEFFCLDSRFCLALIRALARRMVAGDGAARWLLAAAAADRLLDDWGLGAEEKLSFVTSYGSLLAGELRLGARQQRAIGRFHRQVRDVLDQVTGDDAGLASVLGEPIRDLLRNRSRRITGWLGHWRSVTGTSPVNRPWTEIRTSLFHMHCNRLFASQPRRQETMLLQLLRRTYTSRLKREAARTPPHRKEAAS